MQISYDDIFKYTDIYNPISLQILNAAGKLAGLAPGKIVIDLGSGKGYPALFWASAFGVNVEGVDISKINMDYANSRAKLLNLSERVQFSCGDLRTFKPAKTYDFVSSLGIESEFFGGRASAFALFKSMLKDKGAIFYCEPVWRKRPVPPKILKSLMCKEEIFLTMAEVDKIIEDSGLEQLGRFVASKEDWELYARSPILSVQEIKREKKELAAQAQAFLEGFKTEAEAAGKYWDDVLWVLKPR